MLIIINYICAIMPVFVCQCSNVLIFADFGYDLHLMLI